MTTKPRTQAERKPPPITQQIYELKCAGWLHIRGRLWKAPTGGYFQGPHGAWLAMKRREPAYD